MTDPFTDSDLGDGNESVLVADAPAPTEAVTDSPAAAEQPAPSDDQTTAVDQGAPVQDGTQQEQPPSTEEVELTDFQKMEKEVEEALADEKTPKPPWVKNVEKVFKTKLDEANAKLEPYTAYGAPEEVAEKLSLLSGLETVRSNPSTGMPERTTEPFVKGLFEKDPAGAYQLMADLAQLPSPYTQGLTVTQELFKAAGIDPARIEDVKQFAANGYQMQASAYPAPDQNDLAELPAHLHATFGKLDPDTRDGLMVLDEAVRNRSLEAYKTDLETKERESHETQTREQREAEAQAQQQAAFKANVDAKGDENFQQAGTGVLNSFVESLAKQAGMTTLDSHMIATTVLSAYEPTIAGKAIAAALKADGIELDPTIPAAIAELQEKAKHAAYYQIIGDQAALSKAVADQVGLQERILAKGNKIIAQLAQKRNGNVINQVQKDAAALAQTQTSRHAAAGVGGRVNGDFTPTYDFSDESYEQAIRSDPHFQKRR